MHIQLTKLINQQLNIPVEREYTVVDINNAVFTLGISLDNRKQIITLCLLLDASLEQTNSVLDDEQYRCLYPKDLDDAIIIYGIVNNIGYHDIMKIMENY